MHTPCFELEPLVTIPGPTFAGNRPNIDQIKISILLPLYSSAELFHYLFWGNKPKSAQNRWESLCTGLVGTVPDMLGLVWPSFRPNAGSKLKIRPDPSKFSGPS